jgi:hypothetical protein
MGEDFEPSVDEPSSVRQPSNERILLIMAVLGIVGGIAGIAINSFRFGLGIVVGTALAFANYFWLKRSLRTIFSAAESGEKPRMLAGKYFVRYLVLGAVVAIIYFSGMLPIVAVILGLGGFGFAVVIDGLIRIFQGAEIRTE